MARNSLYGNYRLAFIGAIAPGKAQDLILAKTLFENPKCYGITLQHCLLDP